MEKQYGKLTEEQFRALIQKVPELRREGDEFAEALRQASPAKLKELLGDDFCWAFVYELSFIQHIALLVVALGATKWLKQAAASADPQQFVIDEIDKVDLDAWAGGESGYFEKKHVIAISIALQKTILSVMLYTQSLSALTEEVRRGNDEAFFKAVRVDRTILACPTFAARLSRAELRQDKHFFLRLRNSLKGPSQKHWEAYKDLRYALVMLREMGLKHLSDEQLETLLVDQLGVYPKSYNARRNLRKQFYQSRKITTT